MKKLLYVIFLLVASSTVSYSQFSLSPVAREFKESSDENIKRIYYSIREYAVENWEDNNVMIVSEINQNIEALVKVIKLQENMVIKNNPQLFRNALRNWVHPMDKGLLEDYLTESPEKIFSVRFNWLMVQMELEQQINASDY